MNIRELTIGDWVYNSHHKKNIRLTQYDFFTHTHNKYGEQILMPNAKPTFGLDLHPIPITEEILKQNGFQQDCCNSLHWFFQMATVEENVVSRSCVNVFFEDRTFIDILDERSSHTSVFRAYMQYVHQLQQAIRLCGFEIEINL